MSRRPNTKRAVVYTAIFGGYDELREPREQLPNVDYVCFTDNPYLRSDAWTVRYCEPTGDPIFQAKRLKVVPHEALDCEMSLWIDGRIELYTLNGLFDRPLRDVAFPKHPNRQCIYEEAAHCKRTRRGDPSRIDASVARYQSEGFPANAGLWQCGVIFRRHSLSTAAFNVAWWRELTLGSARDQISAPVVLRRLGTAHSALPENVPHFQVGYHRQKWRP